MSEEQNKSSKTVIVVRPNGPLLVEGDFEIRDGNGNSYDLAGRTKISMCRCAASKNLPFCDGAHKSCGFVSEVEARELPPPAPSK